MTLTDEELDRDWKPSGRRPQSTIARSFSAELADIFRLESDVNDLDDKVDKRKQHISTQATELEALEARIREMEERLRRSQQSGTAGFFRPGITQRTGPEQSPSEGDHRQPSSPPPVSPPHRSPRRLREDAPPPPLPKDSHHMSAAGGRSSRPGTARQGQHTAPGSGAMPPTPVASEGEYEVVDKSDLLDDEDDDEDDDRPTPVAPPPRRRV